MPRCCGLSYMIAFFASKALLTLLCAAGTMGKDWVLGGWLNLPFLEGSAEGPELMSWRCMFETCL